jgi:hypothetical protein
VSAEADFHGLSIVLPPSHRLTQGSVFTCGIAEDYSGCTTCGLIITARCDAEQDKVRIYNYLPIVRLNDWLHRDGRGILSERLMAETLGKMKTVLKESGHALSILDTETPRSILDKLFPGGEKNANKARERFERLCVSYDLAVRGTSSSPAEEVCLEIASSEPHLKDVLLRELVHQRLAGYYFYDRIEPNGDNNGYVVLLREIRMMSRAIAGSVVGGLDRLPECGFFEGVRFGPHSHNPLRRDQSLAEEYAIKRPPPLLIFARVPVGYSWTPFSAKAGQ